ncbi:MAG: DNA polymerase III subunit alpha [Francisellaceae bacterium]
MSALFAHLHLHSEYSLVDSIIRLKPLIAECRSKDIVAVALTDVCNLFAAVKFYRAALSGGIKPIFGSDVQIEVNGEQYALTLLARDDTGYHNIVRLISYAYLNGARRNGIPVIEESWLMPEKLRGIIALSGGMQGQIARLLLAGHPNQARACAQSWARRFETNSFFIELTRLNREREDDYLQGALAIAQELDIPVVATNDVRFFKADDYDDHEVRVGIYEGYTLLDETRKSHYSHQQYFKSASQMHELFNDIPEAIDNSLYIARSCNVTFELGKAVLPQFDIPSGMTEAQYFSRVSHDGLNRRFELLLKGLDADNRQAKKQHYIDRLNTEIDVICQMGFPGYFLIVADFIRWSKDHDIPVGPGRGSGAGSLVAYALEITDIDPIPYGLLFERFLNPERVSMPDFDIDFCMDGRDRVIEYVAEKYGHASVSQIITYGSMAAKAVVRDVGRVMGQPYGFVDKIAKLIPNDLGIKLSDAMAKGTPLYDYAKEDEAVEMILNSALKLEGLTRSVGRHAAGVVISPSEVTDFSPIYCEEGSKALVTQFDKKDVEDVGLVKFDFLGLRNLTIIHNAVAIINRQPTDNSTFDISLIDMNDKLTFALLQKAETTGVFQLESRGMKELIKRLRPDCFEDIIALVALYRPGPLGSGMVDDFVNRKHGRQEVRYPHSDLEEVLKETYGTILYQEQVMQIAQILANYSLGAADLLRRAMGKKIPEEMAKQRESFEQGAAENGIDVKLASSIFDLMEEFAKYGFNKSHSAAYALVSYQTAYLKAHYPQAFMAALLSSDMDNTDKVVNFVAECKKMKVSLRPPNVNTSLYAFTVNTDNEVVYGLGAIKGVGHSAIDEIIAKRKQDGNFSDLYDFCRRVDLRKVNKRVIEALIYAGGFDELKRDRSLLIAELEDALKAAEQHSSTAQSGQHDLFGFDTVINTETKPMVVAALKWTNRQRLIYEKSVLGMFFSGHLIDEDRFWLNALKVTPLNKISPTRRKESILLAGSIVSITQRKTRSGQMMGVITIDDGYERMEMVVFNELYERVKPVLNPDEVIVIEGEAGIDSFNDQLRITALDIQPIRHYVDTHVKSLHCQLDMIQLGELRQCLVKSGAQAVVDGALEVSLGISTNQYKARLISRLTLSAYDFVRYLQGDKDRTNIGQISVSL